VLAVSTNSDRANGCRNDARSGAVLTEPDRDPDAGDDRLKLLRPSSLHAPRISSANGGERVRPSYGRAVWRYFERSGYAACGDTVEVPSTH
jgi:hypothetical protein